MSKIPVGVQASLLFVLITILGCEAPENPKLVAARNAALAKDADSRAVTLTQAKEVLADENEIVLLGRVGSGSLDPFEKGKSVFVLSEAPDDHAANADHDANECPFCRRKMAEAPLAQIEMVDANGVVYPFGASELFRIRAGQLVVVTGRGRYEKESDMLLIQGRSLYVMP